MKKALFSLLGVLLLLPASTASAVGTNAIVEQLDIVTQQGNGSYHPNQIAVERTMQADSLQAERLRMTPLPTANSFSMAAVVGTNNVYVADESNATLSEINPDSGQVIRQFRPSARPSGKLQGIATGVGEDIYVYYNGAGLIQRLKKDGSVVDSFAAPTPYGHSMAYQDGSLYLLDDRGLVYQIDAWSKQLKSRVQLVKPNGAAFGSNETFALMWDGKYWNIADAQDGWKLYRYDAGWTFRRTLDLGQWSMTGLLFNGQDYYALNSDNDRIVTIRLSDDVAGDVSQKVSDHYQYIGNVLTTTKAGQAFPQYADHDIDLVYNDPVSITADYLKPYVAYLDSSGQRVDSMFDSFLFLPMKASADRMFYNKTAPTQWTSYLTKTMSDMAALNQEWSAKNRDLGQSNKAKVWIAVPNPSWQDKSDVRTQAIHQYVDQAISLFRSKMFASVELRGFYWYNEEANYQEPLVVDFNQYVHAKGYQSLWIPYQTAQSVSDYSANGFDEVFQQPNYYFIYANFAANPNRFYNLTWTGQRYRKGVEMELDTDTVFWRNPGKDPEYRSRFQEYLHYGLIEGWLQSSKAWYDNQAVYEMYRNRDPLYQAVHQVLKGTYSEPNVNVVTPQDGNLRSSMPLSLTPNAKLRIDLLTDQPYNVQKVILHTDDTTSLPASYVGAVRVDEELYVDGDGKLAKRDIGGGGNGLRIGFNKPLTNNVQVTVVPEGMTPFADIKRGSTSLPAVSSLSDEGIVNGMMEKGRLLFKPLGRITRAQFATMLMNAYHLVPHRAVSFGDSQGAWFSSAVAAVSEKGWMQGYDSGHFAPDEEVTMEQVAAILVRILNSQGMQASPDGMMIVGQSSLSPWAKNLVLEGKQLGVYTDHFGTSTFVPSMPASRVDVAMVLYNALGVGKKNRRQ